MTTGIACISSYESNDSLVILASQKSNLKKHGLTDKETGYIREQIELRFRKNGDAPEGKLDDNVFLINQYNREVFVVIPNRKSERHLFLEECRRSGHHAVRAVNSEKLKNVTLVNDTGDEEALLALAEGMMLSNYQFLKYKKDPQKEAHTLRGISLLKKEVSQKNADHLALVVNATCTARDLVNEHPAVLTAVQLAEEARKLCKEAGIRVEVFNKAKIEALKMGGLLAVNRGSQLPPTFTVMEWKPPGTAGKKPIVLVGKGVVYDTGGLSLKPTPNSMDYMKSDMSGAAAVICSLYAVAKAKLPVHVIGLVPSTDNRPGENAYVPGDVVQMHNGLTVEVLNTDAEGRMILADALSYAKQFGPELVLDIATLTGAAARAIGTQGIVFMGTAGEKIKKDLVKCGNRVYERLVEFPIWEEYDEMIKSDIADIRNIGGAMAGAITAGKFLQHFTSYPWVHLDIAGGAFLDRNDHYRLKNATGIGVRLFFEYLKSRCK